MTERGAMRAIAVGVVFVLGAVCGDCWGAVARAQPPSQAELEAAVVLARYGTNEAGWSHPGDTLLIWQSAETHSDTLAGRVAWLRRHSRCVVAPEPPDHWPPGACRWTRHLNLSGRAPENWPGGWSWPRARPLWLLQVYFALRVISGQETARPCEGNPQTWDGWRWSESRLRLGYTLVHCSDPWTGERLANAGYRFPHWRRPHRSLQRVAFRP